MTNAHELAARDAKCRKIVKAVMADAVKVLTRDLRDEHMWTQLAKIAGTNLPSEESRNRVIEIIREMSV